MSGNTLTLTLKRPDGSLVEATPEQAKRLELLGFTPESDEEKQGRLVVEEKEDYYTTGTQQVKSFAEGVLSGVTVGGSDFLIDDKHAKGRAEYNPGTRVAGQLVGAIAPALVTGGAGGAVAAATPAGALARGAGAAGRAITASRVGRGAVAAGVEGAVGSAGAEAGRAHLAGDPITAESVVSAAGWGALYGAGLGAGAGALGKKAERLGAKLEVEKAVARDAQLIEAAEKAPIISREAYRPLAMAMDDVVRAGDRAAKTVDDALSAAHKTQLATVKAQAAAVKAEAKILDDIVRKKAVGGAEFLQKSNPDLRKAAYDVKKVYQEAAKASKGGDPTKLRAAIDRYRDTLETVNERMGFSFDTSRIVAAAKVEASAESVKALEEVSKLRSAIFELKKFPRTEKDFLAMTPSKAERVFGAYDSVMGGAGGPEMDGFRTALTEGTDSVLSSAGIAGESGAGGLRKAWNTLRTANADVAAAKSRMALRTANGETTGTQKLGILGRILRQAAARGASGAAHRAGAGAFGSSAAYQGAAMGMGALLGGPVGAAGLVAEVTGIRAAVQQTMRQSVAKYGPGAARGARRASGQVGPLAVRLTGEKDDEGGSATQLFHRRSQEIREALPSARDTLFRAVSPLHDIEEVDFAAALHETASKMIEGLMEFLPRDPGDTFSAGRSQWDPDEIEVERFAKVYEVFQNPVGVVQETLTSGAISPDQAKALKSFVPSLYLDLQVGMMERIADPEFAKSLTYEDQADLSILLDLDLHSTFRPDWIKEQQEMYLNRAAEDSMKPSASPGRPAGPPSGLTEAQTVTAR